MGVNSHPIGPYALGWGGTRRPGLEPVLRRLRQALATPSLDRPAFLIGCGRSGTTMLGTCLGTHPLVTYLNEPRDVWSRCLPSSDIWSEGAQGAAGRITLDGADATPAVVTCLTRALAKRVERSGRPRLLEKLPINSFRLPFLSAAFPGGRFLIIIREGTVVARSIQQFAKREGWFGVRDYKWQLLAQLAERQSESRGLAARCATDFERGLLEWRLSVEATLRFAAASSCCHMVRYEELLATPIPVVSRILEFLELPPAREVLGYAATEIGRQDSSSQPVPLDEVGCAIAGSLLVELGYRAPSP